MGNRLGGVLPSVGGSDTATASADGDGATESDTRAGTLRVWDDASGPVGEFRIEARITAVG